MDASRHRGGASAGPVRVDASGERAAWLCDLCGAAFGTRGAALAHRRACAGGTSPGGGPATGRAIDAGKGGGAARRPRGLVIRPLPGSVLPSRRDAGRGAGRSFANEMQPNEKQQLHALDRGRPGGKARMGMHGRDSTAINTIRSNTLDAKDTLVEKSMNQGANDADKHSQDSTIDVPKVGEGDDDASAMSLWVCDVCGVAKFENYDDAVAHEKQCTGKKPSEPNPKEGSVQLLSSPPRTRKTVGKEFDELAFDHEKYSFPGCSSFSTRGGGRNLYGTYVSSRYGSGAESENIPDRGIPENEPRTEGVHHANATNANPISKPMGNTSPSFGYNGNGVYHTVPPENTPSNFKPYPGYLYRQQYPPPLRESYDPTAETAPIPPLGGAPFRPGYHYYPWHYNPPAHAHTLPPQPYYPMPPPHPAYHHQPHIPPPAQLARPMTFCRHHGCNAVARKSGFCFGHYEELRQKEPCGSIYGDKSTANNAMPGAAEPGIPDKTAPREGGALVDNNIKVLQNAPKTTWKGIYPYNTSRQGAYMEKEELRQKERRGSAYGSKLTTKNAMPGAAELGGRMPDKTAPKGGGALIVNDIKVLQNTPKTTWKGINPHKTSRQGADLEKVQVGKDNKYARWTKEADDALRQAVGQQKLGQVAKGKNTRWTKEEDDALRQAVGQHINSDKNWSVISQSVTKRTAASCRTRWESYLDPGITKGPWSAGEDETLKRLVGTYGLKQWTLVASGIPGRVATQCRERWCRLEQITKRKITPKVAMASVETKLTREDVAKLPVAFGFCLEGGNNESKNLAQKASKKWFLQGFNSITPAPTLGRRAASAPLQKSQRKRRKLTPQQTIAPQPNPKVAMASEVVKTTDCIGEVVAKLPVAFGFWLDDLDVGGVSMNLARTAAEKWIADGQNAAKLENGKQGSSTKGMKKVAAKRCVANGLQKRAKRSERNFITPPSVPAGNDFPAGWTTKTYERNTPKPGRTTTYKVFITPSEKHKFRSRKSPLIFVEIMREQGVNANEEIAFNQFKTRGHKL